MEKRATIKIAVDTGMTILLLLLMAYELVGREAHEWLGAGMFALFIAHHCLNWRWSRSLLRGKYPPMRILQTVLAGLVFLTMLGSLVSAVLVSREVFAFLPISGGRELGRTLHMLSAYWGFVLLSLHLGLHWGAIAIYGAYAFLQRGIPGYLFLQSQFVFFDFEEPLIFFFLDYLAAMGLFVWLGHWLTKAMLRRQGKRGRGIEPG